SLDQHIRDESRAGLAQRLDQHAPAQGFSRENYEQRLETELDVIVQMGFEGYFLIVADFINWAKQNDIPVGPGRGSGAGSLVAYALGITDLDPLRYGLLFERFLNPERISMPDFDVDFCQDRRDEVIRYVAGKYGADHVAQIVTFSTIKARAAVRDAARVLGFPYSVGDRIAKAMPPLVMGRATPLSACLEKDPENPDGYAAAAELRQMYETDPDAKRVIDVARGIEGLRRQDSIHAAAVVITHDALTEHLPIQRKPEPGSDPSLAPIVTQYEMHGVSDLGLLKMDFLGLRNLTVIDDALRNIKLNSKPPLDLENLELDDAKAYELLASGDTLGVFQLDGGPMRDLLRRMVPTTFEDISAVLALYRPGPMGANAHNDYADRKNGRQEVRPIHPELAEPLADIL
ncbi:MAG: DNA polymerase III subunit alpha, partial [Steroidobacteraceae bacterium]